MWFVRIVAKHMPNKPHSIQLVIQTACVCVCYTLSKVINFDTNILCIKCYLSKHPFSTIRLCRLLTAIHHHLEYSYSTDNHRTNELVQYILSHISRYVEHYGKICVYLFYIMTVLLLIMKFSFEYLQFKVTFGSSQNSIYKNCFQFSFTCKIEFKWLNFLVEHFSIWTNHILSRISCVFLSVVRTFHFSQWKTVFQRVINPLILWCASSFKSDFPYFKF